MDNNIGCYYCGCDAFRIYVMGEGMHDPICCEIELGGEG
jgi:hypothetical protein